jgi:hypothetical protein
MLQPASRQLFGRERELAVLIRALADSERGRARVVWIGGEPGIGKTRLAEELGATAATRCATVAWARCVDAETAPPYWPWAESIRALLQTVPLEALHLPVSCLDRLSALVPDLMPRPATLTGSAALTTASDRYQLFDAVRTVLQRAFLARASALIRRGHSRLTVTDVPGPICHPCPRPFSQTPPISPWGPTARGRFPFRRHRLDQG